VPRHAIRVPRRFFFLGGLSRYQAHLS